MSNALLLVPDFLLIALGFVICRYTVLNRPVWEAAERLVYYLLFPVLLFNSISRSPLQGAHLLGLGGVAILATLVGIALVFALRRWPGVDPHLHASGGQVAFRFNSFIALALAERLGGRDGLAWMALLLALCVPIVNVAAVWLLARRGGQSYVRELARNPLIVSTVAGLVANLCGLHLPDVVTTTMQRIGVAALPLGLMAVGAGLQFGRLKSGPRLAAAILCIRHVVLPAVAIGLALAVALPPAQRYIAVLFAAMPTASTTYVLAVRMGGDGPYVAGLVTLSTLLGMVSVPVWIAVLSALPA
jgi:predicted permease